MTIKVELSTSKTCPGCAGTCSSAPGRPPKHSSVCALPQPSFDLKESEAYYRLVSEVLPSSPALSPRAV
ncbi:hypothetical protein Y1Q_0009795 [Alligator mississippiensis]|uniref:Uncharacterized protein n=1 Tax=Alligator mississippiensis TaxID=8496 RepID=A0A151MWY2_ALLMI|nr:hypothetical protein Y1Q_0009795 [Alligator mississippiensis]